MELTIELVFVRRQSVPASCFVRRLWLDSRNTIAPTSAPVTPCDDLRQLARVLVAICATGIPCVADDPLPVFPHPAGFPAQYRVHAVFVRWRGNPASARFVR